MLILGIDTSCDDTSAALLHISEGRAEIVTNIVSSQSDIHTKYGGIVPELASRRHIEMIWPVVAEAMADRAHETVDAVAVCYGPGLIGSLLVGCSFAKSMSHAWGKPLVAVNHLEGHLLSVYLSDKQPEFPFLSLVVSGGHTALYKVRGYCDYEELGRTRDDAAGEAYDKVSKLLGLGYPGGPIIDRMARAGDTNAVRFPKPVMGESRDFSFSGLKTAVRVTLQKQPELKPEDVAAAFQHSVVETLVRKCRRAMRDTGIKRLAISGGVAANSALRASMAEMCKEVYAELYLPSTALCTDNAAMIAMAGYHRYMKGERASLEVNPRAHLPL